MDPLWSPLWTTYGPLMSPLLSPLWITYGSPIDIVGLPEDALNSPMGHMFRPMLEQMEQRMRAQRSGPGQVCVLCTCTLSKTHAHTLHTHTHSGRIRAGRPGWR